MSVTASTAMKRSRDYIATHSGSFHADESLAVALLRSLPSYAAFDLVRTRDPVLLKDATIVVDVGGTYDASSHRYDHHQRGFDENFGQGFVTKLSSAGLVYKHFGLEIIANKLALPVSHPTIPLLHTKLYADFIEALDGIDNGISAYSGVAKYRSRTDLSSRIGSLNPRWNETSNDDELDKRFEGASALAGSEFFKALDYAANAWLPARDIIVTAITDRKSVDASGSIVVFSEFAPWKEHLHILEQELSIPTAELPLYVLYPDESGKWRIQAVPKSSESFESRKALPEQWRGIRDGELDALTGIEGCIFVHASGFIGGNKTKEGAMKMAIQALAM